MAGRSGTLPSDPTGLPRIEAKDLCWRGGHRVVVYFSGAVVMVIVLYVYSGALSPLPPASL